MPVKALTSTSWAVAVAPGKLTVDGLEAALRRRERPIIGRISQGQYLLDVRTLWDEDFADIETAVNPSPGGNGVDGLALQEGVRRLGFHVLTNHLHPRRSAGG